MRELCCDAKRTIKAHPNVWPIMGSTQMACKAVMVGALM